MTAHENLRRSTVASSCTGIRELGEMNVTNKTAQGQVWAIILAAGEGKRLRSLTRDATGRQVPKQFCSLDGGPLLIEQTVARARSVVPEENITAVVAPAHVRYWKAALRDMPFDNICVQPLDRGTAVGILWPTLKILARDPLARLLILPSDHHVDNEETLTNAMRAVLDDVQYDAKGVALLGIEASEPDTELGYIVARPGSNPRLRPIDRFVEKPSPEEAQRLFREGALWNSFIIGARAASLVSLFEHYGADIVRGLQAADWRNDEQLVRIYRELPTIDFSRHIVSGQEQRVAVATVPACGWNDLGTPHRLVQTLARHSASSPGARALTHLLHGGTVNLTERWIQLQADTQEKHTVFGPPTVGARETMHER